MDRRKLRILLVANSESDAKEFYAALEKKNIAVSIRIATSLEQSRETLRIMKPDLVVTSLNLPDGLGTELTRDENGYPQSFPILTMIPTSNVRDAVEAIKAGAWDCLEKSPESFKILDKILDRAIAQWGTVWEQTKNHEAMFETCKNAQGYLDVAGMIIVALDNNCTVTYVNKKCADLLGFPCDQIVGRNWVNSFVPKERRPSVRRSMTRILSGKIPAAQYVEDILVTGDGQQRLVAWHNSLLRDSKGNMIGILGSGEDITKRKSSEEALRASEERFRAIFEGAQDCIMIKDKSLRYTEVNPAFCKLLGLSASQIIGLRAEDLFGNALGHQISERSARVVEGESIECEQTRIVGNIPITFHDTISPLKDSRGQIIGLCYVSRDVTERKQICAEPQPDTHDYPSPSMRSALKKALVATNSDSTVLLQGESGSGKDFLARWIHERSHRSSGPFFSINCAGLPRDLAESELFGHEKGAFTGADRKKKGLLELAEGGTILLNEIGELELTLQAKLLAFLDTKSFLRIGGEKQIYVNARLIAASHRDLVKEVEKGHFLEPLYYRLCVFPINVPPLRERLQDFNLLCGELVQRLAVDMQLQQLPTIDSKTLEKLKRYRWPGNVRELKNVLERSLILWKGGVFDLEFPLSDKESDVWTYTVSHSPHRSFRDTMDDVAMALCDHVLKLCHGNKKQASHMLQISRETFYRYIRKLHHKSKKWTD